MTTRTLKTQLALIAVLATLLISLTTTAHSQPAGTIIAYGGDIAKMPPGYLLCDGQEYATKQFPDLSAAIRANWGSSAPGKFKVPDLRGLFLRGVSGNRPDSFSDPDANFRISVNGSAKGNAVGSIQNDTIKTHQHTYVDAMHRNAGLSGDHGPTVADSNAPEQTTSVDANGRETRPKNAYVYWLIKVK